MGNRFEWGGVYLVPPLTESSDTVLQDFFWKSEVFEDPKCSVREQKCGIPDVLSKAHIRNERLTFSDLEIGRRYRQGTIEIVDYINLSVTTSGDLTFLYIMAQ